MEATVEKEIPNGVPCTSYAGQVLTCQQIKDIVGNGWAIIKNAEFNGCIFLRGELIYYGNDKKDVYQRERRAGEKEVYFKYCGERDPNTVYLL